MIRRLLVTAMLLAASPAWAEELDRVAIASRLVADGLWDRAATVLDELEAPPKGDEVRFHTLRGLVALKLGDPAGALLRFDAAIATGLAEPMVHVQRAQALYGLQRPKEAIMALDEASDAATGLSGAWQLRARCHRDLGDEDSAWTALAQGRERFPDHLGLAEDQLLQLIDLGLTREALDRAPDLTALGAHVGLWLTVGERLRRSSALDDAMAWLEDARARFPDEVGPRVALASACLDAERPLCAATQLQEAAAFDPVYASESAECFRRAGELDRALYMNAQVEDPAIKVRQRLGLLLEAQQFDQAAALDPRLRRHDLLVDENLAYALAYAHFQTSDFDRSEALLKGIASPSLFRQATALRQTMDSCRAGEGGCP